MTDTTDESVPPPPGLTGLAVLYTLAGAVVLLVGIFMLAIGGAISIVAIAVPDQALAVLGLAALALVVVGSGVAAILTAIGMGSGERWSWPVATGLAGLFTVAMVGNIVQAPTSGQALGAAVPTLIGVVLLVYWFHDRVRSYFGW